MEDIDALAAIALGTRMLPLNGEICHLDLTKDGKVDGVDVLWLAQVQKGIRESPGQCGTEGLIETKEIDFTLFPNYTIGTVPFRIAFSANKPDGTENDAVQYTWNFGDGFTGSGKEVTHEFIEPGIFTVELEVLASKDNKATFHGKARKQITVLGTSREIVIPPGKFLKLKQNLSVRAPEKTAGYELGLELTYSDISGQSEKMAVADSSLDILAYRTVNGQMQAMLHGFNAEACTGS